MTPTLSAPTAPAWSGAIFQSAEEFEPTTLPLLAGTLPAGLRGTLYRNGPATLERGGDRVGHWFDGDGGILAVRFTDSGAAAQYRYVKTEGYLQEQAAGRFLLAGYGMLPPGRWWERFSRDLKNVANTSVLAVPDKLLALWEGGKPYALDLDTLETIGPDDLNGLEQAPYSAHPKRDPVTGDLFNFGVSFGTHCTLNLYRSDATGTIQQQGTIALRGFPVIHDFVMAGRYLVFCIPPVRLNTLPVLARLQSYSDALMWRPQQGTEVLVVDRDSLTLVSRFETEPWYQWHFGNGYELPDQSVVLLVARYPDFQTNQRLKEVAAGAIQTPAEATLWQLRLDPRSGRLLEMQAVLDRSCEFPVTDPHQVGQPCRYTYLNLHSSAIDARTELFDTIARFDHQTGTLTEARLGQNRYPSEPIYAPDADNPEQGWILTLVYDGSQHQSEVWVFAADRLDAAPTCRLALPKVIPFGFHGTWRAA